MIASLWKRWREARALERHAIPDALWELTLLRYPFLARRSAEDIAELRRLSSLFLASKEFHGVGGFEVTDEIALAVAAQACLPVLKLGLSAYDSFVGIVMHADEVLAPREVMDEDGVVHQYEEALVGEAMEGGPLMLSWAAAAPEEFFDEESAVFNVVIHEFAHVIDARSRLSDQLDDEWNDFCDRVDAGEDTLIDPYGAESPQEFFAVAVEAFFVAPAEMEKEQPALHRLLSDFFQQ